jgi:hypothetical protein
MGSETSVINNKRTSKDHRKERYSALADLIEAIRQNLVDRPSRRIPMNRKQSGPSSSNKNNDASLGKKDG